MEIKTNLNNIQSSSQIERSQPKKAPSQTSLDHQTDFTNSQALEKTLRETPDVRADKIARAKQLVSDPNYPSAAIMKKVASLLAPDIADKVA